MYIDIERKKIKVRIKVKLFVQKIIFISFLRRKNISITITTFFRISFQEVLK